MKKLFTLVIAIVVVAFASQAQGTWTQKADFGGTARYGAAGFSIGSKGYIGTGDGGGGYKKDFWEYNPDASSWTQKADFGGYARASAVGFSIGDKGYVGTGYYYDNYDSITLYKDFWEYDPSANTWTQKVDFGGAARVRTVGFSIGSKGYLGTGNEGAYPYYKKDFWEYDPALNNWTQKADFGGSGRVGAVGFSIGNKGYLGTGYDGSNDKKDVWEYDPDVNNWTQKADFGGNARNNAAAFSIGNKGYLGTGYGGGYTKDFWEYDPDTNTWTQKADFGGNSRDEVVGFSIGSKGYLGTGGNVSPEKDFWEYTPDNSCTTPKAHISPIGNLDICNTGYVKLLIKSDGNYNYQWNRNGVDIPGATNELYKAKKKGDYRVIVSSGVECSGVSKKVAVYSSCKLSEEDEFISSLNLFPNPTARTFTLDLKLDDEENSQATIQVLNMLGQVVYDETTSVVNGVLQKEIQLSDAAADGMYLVKVTIGGHMYSAQINSQK